MLKFALSVPLGGTSNSLSLMVFHSAGIRSRLTLGGALSGLPVAGSNCITGPRVEILTRCFPRTLLRQTLTLAPFDRRHGPQKREIGVIADRADGTVGHHEVDHVVVQAAKGPFTLLIGVPAWRAGAARAIGQRSR